MSLASSASPRFDHGAALRVPPPHDVKNWRTLWMWLGEGAQAMTEAGALQIHTPEGWTIAQPGDWIVLSVSGEFYVAHAGRRALDS
ncbi:hypothetical protein [Phenylobacterium sp.]|uniref:hypothetical protein n=1 Tax=Phenylobacterium sp. TaxID=1871053 RepID=UPI00286C246F|nr:hypothetical protein [Phenylobacterium sp.]